jgi:putative transposase
MCPQKGNIVGENNHPSNFRRSLRLPHYDYSQAGGYFVNFCLQTREGLFGEIVNEFVNLNEIGLMVADTWHQIPDHDQRVEIDEFVVMPNHVHGIIRLVGADPRVQIPKKS